MNTYFDDMPNPSNETCFLCSCEVTEISKEHVFPKWLQHDMKIWDSKLTLLNGSKIHYKDLTIPCCKDCNTKHLSQLEENFKKIINKETCQYSPNEKNIIYLWCLKIFYGLLYKSLFLKLDRSSNSCETIITTDVLNQLKDIKMFLQGIRGKHKFNEPRAFSVITLNLYDHLTSNFNYADFFKAGVIALRVRNKGIIVCIWDRKFSEYTLGEYAQDFKDEKIHPIQFDELVAKVLYQQTLIRNTPSYIHSYNEITKNYVTSYISSPIYVEDDWNNEDLSKFLCLMMRPWFGNTNPESYYNKDTKEIVTFLRNSDGNVRLSSKEDWEHELGYLSQ